MRRLLVTALLILTMFVMGWYIGERRLTRAYAQSTISVPKSWGSFKGAGLGGMIFEDSAGTLRLVHIDDGSVLRTVDRK